MYSIEAARTARHSHKSRAPKVRSATYHQQPAPIQPYLTSIHEHGSSKTSGTKVHRSGGDSAHINRPTTRPANMSQEDWWAQEERREQLEELRNHQKPIKVEPVFYQPVDALYQQLDSNRSLWTDRLQLSRLSPVTSKLMSDRESGQKSITKQAWQSLDATSKKLREHRRTNSD